MADTSDPSDGASGASARNQTRANKARAKEQKRAEKAAAKAQRETDLARLNEETLGKLMGFRVFKDGTVQKESSSGSSTSPVGSALQSRLGQVFQEMKPPPRSAVLNVTLSDKRIRKPFARARAAMPSTGLVGNGRDHFGAVSLTIATYDWTEKVVASSEKDVAALEALNGMLLQAQGVSASRGETVPEQTQPAPPLPPSPPQTQPAPPMTPGDVPGALRDLKGLHDEGLLTDDEYETRRQALLSHLPIVTQTSAPAGWHPDPHGTARLRWWDGQAWGEDTAP